MSTDAENYSSVASPLILPGNRYPTGWFQIGWSDDIAPGEVRTVHYFDQDIVLWRSESGELHATEPYCLHLGAHVGVDSVVEGEDLVCAWHHWHWNGEGRNTLIPYSAQKCKPQLQMKMWPLVEWCGCIVVWYDSLGAEPTWRPPSVAKLDQCHPVTPELRDVWRLRTHPQVILENGPDVAHVQYIHGASEMGQWDKFEFNEHVWSATATLVIGGGKASTWVTPEGEVKARIEVEAHGLGTSYYIWPAPIIDGLMLMNSTPVDDTYCDYWWTMTSVDDGSGEGMSRRDRAVIEMQRKTVMQDFRVWENMRVMRTNNLAPEEAMLFAKFRRWSWQFYPEQPGAVEQAVPVTINGSGRGRSTR